MLLEFYHHLMVKKENIDQAIVILRKVCKNFR